MNYRLDSLIYNKKQTTPPSYYTEGSLIYAMENPFEFVEDEKERKILKRNKWYRYSSYKSRYTREIV